MFFGIDWNGPISDTEDLTEVDVPNILNPLLEEDYMELCCTISPNSESSCFGVDIYINVLHFVCQKLSL